MSTSNTFICKVRVWREGPYQFKCVLFCWEIHELKLFLTQPTSLRFLWRVCCCVIWESKQGFSWQVPFSPQTEGPSVRLARLLRLRHTAAVWRLVLPGHGCKMTRMHSNRRCSVRCHTLFQYSYLHMNMKHSKLKHIPGSCAKGREHLSFLVRDDMNF